MFEVRKLSYSLNRLIVDDQFSLVNCRLSDSHIFGILRVQGQISGQAMSSSVDKCLQSFQTIDSSQQILIAGF